MSIILMTTYSYTTQREGYMEQLTLFEQKQDTEIKPIETKPLPEFSDNGEYSIVVMGIVRYRGSFEDCFEIRKRYKRANIQRS